MAYFKTTTGPGIFDKIMTKDGLEASTYDPSIYIDDEDVTDSTYELQPGNIKRVSLWFYGGLNDKDGDFLAEFYFKALGQVTLDRDGRSVHFQIDDQLRPDGYAVQQRLKEGEDIKSRNKFIDDNLDSALARTKLTGDFMADYLATNTFKEG